MSRFVIECPVCGKYAEGRTGFFARKKIDCACGYTIDVRTDKLTARACPHCGNNVVFDQTKGEKAKCPVCGELINTLDETSATAEFSCAQCGIRLRADRSAKKYTCPVCDCENNVTERLMAEKIKKDGLASIIKYEGDIETLVWKHPIEDFNYGSQLIVHESQEAIFFRDGQALDLFGPGRYTLETQQLPLLEKVYKLPADTEGTFHSEVYFINKVVQMAIKWGTPDKVRFIDPLTGVPLELGASGEMNLQVSDSRRLLVKLVGTMKGVSWTDGAGMSKSLQSSFRPLITTAVKANLSSVIKEESIDLLEIDEKLDLLSARLRDRLVPGFEEYGLTIPQFYVTSVVLPEDDPNFRRIRELHTIALQTRVFEAEAAIRTAQAQTEAQYKTAQAEAKAQYRTAEEQTAAAIEAAHREAELQRQTTETEVSRKEAERRVISAQAEAQAQRMAGLTEAEIMAAKGYSQRDVLQTEVQKAYAESIGNMGPAITTGGGSSSGIVGDMLGLSVGLAAAQAISPQIGNIIQGMQPGGTPAQNTAPAAGGWDCPECGTKNIQSRFCPNCGAKKPEPVQGWTCPNCGKTGVTSKFCPECGTKKPEPAQGWTCPNCGKTGITSKFCPECGAKKPDDSWTCPDCGTKDIKTKFCPECGRKKDE